MPSLDREPFQRIENELRSPLPRHVRDTTVTRTVRRLCWNALPALLCVAYFLGARHIRRMQELLKHGVAATARVTGKTTSGDKEAQYTIEYRFQADACTTHCIVSGSDNVTASQYASTQIGDPVPITYMPDNPQDFEEGAITIPRVEAAIEQDIFLILLGPALCLPALALMEYHYAGRRRLLREGIAVPATVQARRTGAGGTMPYTLRYTFSNPITRELVIREMLVSRQEYKRNPEGAVFTLLCLPDIYCNSEPYFKLTEVEVAGAVRTAFLTQTSPE